MATIAKLDVILDLKDNAFATGINSARAKLDSLGASARSAGLGLTAFATVPILGMFAAMINGASDLEEAQSKVDVVFGDSAGTVTDWANNAADAFGITRSDALATAGTFGNMFTAMGFTTDAAADMSTRFIGLAADLGSFNNVDTPAALAAIQSGLVGEYEPLRQFGIMLSEAAVQQYALENGIWDGTGAMTEQQKVLARQGLIWEQTTNAQDDYARTSDGLANSTRRLRAKFLDFMAVLGKKLLPITESVVSAFEDLIDWFNKLPNSIQTGILVVMALVAAIGPLLIGIGLLIPLLSAGLAVFAALVSPIGLVIAAVALLAYLFRDDLAAALDWIIQKVDIFIGTWQQLRTMGLDPVQAALAALQLMFPQIGAVLGQLRGMVDNLTDAFNAFKAGNYAEAFGYLWEAVQNLGSAFKALGRAAWDALASIDWAGIAAAVGGWLGAQLASIKWGSVLSSLGSLALTLDQKIREAVNAIDWEGIGALAGTLTADLLKGAARLMIAGFKEVASDPAHWGKVAFALATSIHALPVALAAWIGDVMRGPAADFIGGFLVGLNLNWIQIAVWLAGLYGRITGAIGDFSVALLTTGMELIGGLFAGIKWAWLGTVMWLGDIKNKITGAVGSFADTLISKGTELINGFKLGIETAWLAVMGWLAALPARVLAAVTSMATTLLARGTELMAGLRAGILSGWELARQWLAQLPSLVKSTIGSLASTLTQKGKDLFAGLFAGILAVWELIANFLGTVQGLVTGYFSGAHLWLLQKGKDIMSGLYAGILAKWEDAKGWLSGIGGRAISAVGSLSGKLTAAGAALIQGLIDGITSMIEPLQAALGAITGLIPDWKGPPQKDAKLLVKNGRLIMGGLGAGLDDGWQDVKRQLRGYTPAMSSLVDGSGIGGSGTGNQPQVIQIITLEPGKWAEFLADAQAGGQFARSFGGEIAMRGGLS